MNRDLNYVFKKTTDNLLHSEIKSLYPLFVYAFGILVILASSVIFDSNTALIILFKLIGLITCVWLFSIVVLNRYIISKKGTILKVHYVSIFSRMLPMVLYQTINYILFVVLYVAITALFIDNFYIGTFTMLYYTILGMVLIIPFTLFYIAVNLKHVNIINMIVFVALVLTVPILYFPQQLPTLVSNILSLNPFYYIIYSIQLNTLGNHWNINRIPSDILFFSQIAIIYLWMFSFYSRMKYNIYYVPTK